jgi:hypothetical protein
VSSDVLSRVTSEQVWWRRVPFARAIVVYLAWRLVTILCVALVELFTHHGLLHDLSIWDGAWFLKAVHFGWPAHLPMKSGHVMANPIAFFPLLPLMMRGLAALTGLSAAAVGVTLSALTGLTAVIAIGVLTSEFASEVKAERAALLFAVSPGSFVFSLIYAEGLLVTFVAFGLWALLRRRWLLAGVLGALATASSPVGLAFAISCVVAAALAVVRERAWRSLAAPLIAPMGFVAWMGYLWIHTGTLMAWRLTERGGWNSYPSLRYPLHILARFLSNPLSPTMTGQILFAGTVVSVLGLVVVFREHQPVAVLTYATSAIALFAISAPVGLRPRFVMLAFPLAIAAATRWSGWRFKLLMAVSSIILLLMTVETLTSFAVFP